jgi:hypothetical protein
MTYVWLRRGEPQTFVDYVTDQDTLDARHQQLLAAITRLRAIESACRTNPGLRGVDSWSQPQRTGLLDAIGDLSQVVRWLVQQQVAERDPAD